MKGYLKYALTIFFLTASLGANAQIKSRYTGGLSISAMELKAEGLNSGPGKPLGIHFGYAFEIPVYHGLTFQPGVLFSSKGTSFRIDSTDHTISPIYIEVPVNAALTIGGDKIKILLLAGPYIAFGVGGTIWESGQSAKDIKFGNGAGRDIRFVDTGLNFEFGVCINNFIVTLHYGKGLTNISGDNPGVSEIKNQVIGISFGTAFIAGK